MVNRKFTITPLGSCRIASPSRAGMETHGIAVIRPRSYGFTHSSAEAVQQARFMVEGNSIPPDLWPLIGRDNDYDKVHNTAFRPADIYLVEISSAKMLTLDNHLIQLNYTQHHFRHFFSDAGRRTRYWDLVAQGDSGELDKLLAAEWSGTAEQRQDTDLLRRIRMVLATDETLRFDLAQLRDLLGDILIVTHVNARDEAGQVLPARDKLINQVRRIATDEGFDLSDPTEVVARVGQEAAVDNESGSYAHYHPPFFSILFEDWYQRFFQPRIDRNAVEKNAVHALVANLNARLVQGARDEVAWRIAALPESLRNRPEIAALSSNAAA